MADGCSCGILATESALCIAAAEGIVGIYKAPEPEGRVGLGSLLFFRDLNPLEPSEIPGLSGGLVGEGSRDVLGEFKIEEGFDKRGVVDARISRGGEAGVCWVSFLPGSASSSALASSVFARLSPVEVSRLSLSSADNAMLENWTIFIGPRQNW